MEDLSWRNIDFTESDRKSNQYYAAENVDIVMEEDPDVMDFEEELIMIKVNRITYYICSFKLMP